MRRLSLSLLAISLVACSGDTFTPGAPAQATSSQGGSAGAPLAGGAAGASGAVASAGGNPGTAGTTSGDAGNTSEGGNAGANAAGTSSSGGGSAGSGAGGGLGGASGQASGGTNAGGTGPGAGAGGQSAGAGGLSAGAGGQPQGGAGGQAGKAGAGGGSAGAAGSGPLGKCQELVTTAVPQSFAAPGCGAGFVDCLSPVTFGSMPRLATTTCGIMVAAVGAANFTTVSFPEQPGIGPFQLEGVATPHSAQMAGSTLFTASTGDAIAGLPYVDSPPPSPFLIAPPLSTAGGGDNHGYRSLFVTDDVVAWTGRQGYELALLPRSGLGCSTDPTIGGCTVEISSVAGNDTAPAPVHGWGVVVIGKRVYWSNRQGVVATDTGDPKMPTDKFANASEVPSSLAVLQGRPLLAQGPILRHLPLLLATTTPITSATLQPIDRDIVDLVVRGSHVFLLAQGVDGVGSATITKSALGTTPITVVAVKTPVSMTPLSLAVSADAVYFSTTTGQLYKLPFKP